MNTDERRSLKNLLGKTQLVLKTCLFAALFVTVAGAQTPVSEGQRSYFKAKEVLDAGVKAIGGVEALRAARTVRRELSGDWFGSGQTPRPYPLSGPTLKTPPSNGQSQIMSFIDYGKSRWLEEAVESDFSGDYIVRITAVGEDKGFETLTYREEKSYYRAFSVPDLSSLRVRRFRRYPEGVLQMAWERPETLEWVGVGEELGRTQQVISFADSTGTRVLLYFDEKTNLLTKSETLRAHAIAGDSSSEVIYDDYRAVGNLKLPFHIIDRVAGVPTEELRVSSIELDATLPEERFRPPQDFVALEADLAEPIVEKLGEGLYLIRWTYNVVFAVFRDHVVVFEGPAGSRYAETCLELIRQTVPEKPIRYVVASHFHFDHIAGLRPYVAAGIPILTTPDAKGVIEQVVAARHTMHPDALSRSPKAPRIEIVAAKRVLDDGTNRVELYDFGPTEHIAQILLAYFPKEKLLFQADLWDILSTDLAIAGTDAVNMARKIQELGLPVERIIPVHGIPGTIETLERGLAVRAKYIQ
jgi:hypothetical protein